MEIFSACLRPKKAGAILVWLNYLKLEDKLLNSPIGLVFWRF